MYLFNVIKLFSYDKKNCPQLLQRCFSRCVLFKLSIAAFTTSVFIFLPVQVFFLFIILFFLMHHVKKKKSIFKYILYFVLNVEMAENDSKKKSEMVETPVNTEGETLIDSPEKLLPEEWIY